MAFSLMLASCGQSEKDYEDEQAKKYIESLSSDANARREAEAEAESKAMKEAENSVSNDVETSSTSSSNNWDQVIAEYESFIDSYISAMKKVKAGDMSLMTEYPALMEKAESLGEKLKENEGQLTKEQMKRYIKLQTKLSNAAVDLL